MQSRQVSKQACRLRFVRVAGVYVSQVLAAATPLKKMFWQDMSEPCGCCQAGQAVQPAELKVL